MPLLLSDRCIHFITHRIVSGNYQHRLQLISSGPPIPVRAPIAHKIRGKCTLGFTKVKQQRKAAQKGANAWRTASRRSERTRIYPDAGGTRHGTDRDQETKKRVGGELRIAEFIGGTVTRT